LTPALQLQLEKAGVSYEIHNKLTQQEVQALYQSADILFFASLYEGFGLPIIEGFSTRIAVITGKVTSMPEIARDAAVLVDPWSIKQIRQAILTITNDDDFRQRLIERGIERVKDFQPVTIAEQYHQQYKQVYHQSR
jgi:glycosyltransferase involved in cell wall biosynthesis